jgi:hypothetical protein
VQRVKGAAVGAMVAVALGILTGVTLHATPLAAIALSAIVGLSVFGVVATRTGPEDYAADAAWRHAAMDLPPVSDRVILERLQASLPGPSPKKKPARKAGSAESETAEIGGGTAEPTAGDTI